jgi:predicted transcriptional regulator
VHPFEQTVRQWTKAIKGYVRESRPLPTVLTPLEQRLLDMLRENTAPIRGMKTSIAAEKLGLAVRDLHNAMRRLSLYKLIYFNSGTGSGEPRKWIAY